MDAPPPNRPPVDAWVVLVPAPAVAPPNRLGAGADVVAAPALAKRPPPLGADVCVAPNMLDPVDGVWVFVAAGAPNKLVAGLGVEAVFPKRPPVVLVAPGAAVDVDVDVLLPL